MIYKKLILTTTILASTLFGLSTDTTDFEEAKKQYASGKFKVAFANLQKILHDNPENLELNFMLGRSAFESGDYETAVMTFERYLLYKPNDNRIKLELARSYYKLGSHNFALVYFNEVLNSHPKDKSVIANIKNYINDIHQRKKRIFISGSLTLATTWDSNARISPAEDSIQTIFGPLNLTVGAEKRQDVNFSISLSLQHNLKLTSNLFWQTNFNNYQAYYKKEKDLNLNYIQLLSGPIYHQDNWQLGIQASLEYMEKDWNRYLRAGGIQMYGAWQPKQESIIAISAKITDREYSQNPHHKALNCLISIKGSQQINKLLLSTIIYYEREETRDGTNWEEDENSYNKTGIVISLEHPLFLNTTGFTSYNFSDAIYDEEYVTFAKDRHDQVQEATIGIRIPIYKSLSAELRYTYTKSKSSISLYEYSRNLTSFSIQYNF